MIKVRDNLWIGNSQDEERSRQFRDLDMIDSVLIVAYDMPPTHGWNEDIEYAHIGLVDGPGNHLSVYHAAVLKLSSMLKRGRVLVCCHGGGRSLAVVIMYLYLVGDGPSWDECIARLEERVSTTTSDSPDVVPFIHEAHKTAFHMMDWTMLDRVLNEEVTE